MRRYATMIAVVLSSFLLLSGGHLAAAYGDMPVPDTTSYVGSASPGQKPKIMPLPDTGDETSPEYPSAAAAGETKPVYPKAPIVGGETKPALPVPSADAAVAAAAAALVSGKAAQEKVDGEEKKWGEEMPWIPDEPVKSKAGTPEVKPIEEDFYASLPNTPQMPPTVAAVEKDEEGYSFTNPAPKTPAPATPAAAVSTPDQVASSSPKKYSPTTPAATVSTPDQVASSFPKQHSPATPAAAVSTPDQVASSFPKQYSPATPAAAVSTPDQVASSFPKQYSPATPAAAVSTPDQVASSSPKQYSPATPAAAAATPSKESSSSTPAATKPAAEQLDGLNEKAVNDIIKEHNIFRAREHVPPIQWNATLASYAQEYAEKRRGDCKLEHSTGPYGENMMSGPEGGQWTWKRTVDEWSDEKKSYDYKTNSCTGGQMCQHYTAVVWKNTTAVGCGRVVCTSGDTLMVCSYWPPGNYIGQKPY